MIDSQSQLFHWEEFTNKRKYDNPVVAFFGKQRFEFISKYIPINEIKDALDVSSGLGWSSAPIPNYIHTIVTDFSFNQLKYNPKRDKIVCVSEKIPFRDKSFSLVYGWEFLHHVPDPIKVVNEMVRVCKDYLVLFEPNRNNIGHFLYGIVRKHERGTLHFHKGMMYKLVKNIKLDVIYCNTVGWIFAGTTPKFMLPIVKRLPYKLPIFGTSNVIICKRRK